jgi:putative transposase
LLGLAVAKGSTLRATLGVEPSYSRPRVSDDNAFSSKVLFRTCQYRLDSPQAGFESLEAAREWTLAFVRWYNQEHRHRGIRYVTPTERHTGDDRILLAARDRVYQAAKARHPERWTGATHNWEPIGEVWLNPVKELSSEGTLLLEAA